ncbi:MAG: type II toxin-antitoxin system ParD family antitoxin [Alphaproteobacteria bacterium]|nr:MAG: type II toxin-antitoxin system ParD family antitoxin [Alphaproteobacteria bacterium]
MHISLTPELEGIVKSKVETGLYNNASEVVREALRFMEINQDLVHQMKLDRLRSHLSVGAAEIAQGQGVVLETASQVTDFFEGLKKND